MRQQIAWKFFSKSTKIRKLLIRYCKQRAGFFTETGPYMIDYLHGYHKSTALTWISAYQNFSILSNLFWNLAQITS